MTPEQIAELEALAEKATPGPWEVEEDPTQDGDHATLVCTSGKFGMMGTWLLDCFHNWKEAAKGERRISWKEAESNATLIVTLVNNLPAILAALKAQQPGEDVVERVARALCAADPEVRHGDAEGVVQQRVHIEWHQYAHAARAAIAAMQESRDD